MSSRKAAPAAREATDEQIVSALAACVRTVSAGISDWEVRSYCWADRFDIEGQIAQQLRNETGERYPQRVTASLDHLRKMAKSGLIVEGEPRNFGRSKALFTTPETAAAIEAERAMTDGERAERTAAAIANRFEHNRQERPDYVSLHPVVTSYGWIPTDGLRAAVDAGLVVKVTNAGNTGYVPVEKYDAWKESFDAEKMREESHKRKLDELRKRVNLSFPPGDGRVFMEITVDQANAILALLEG